MNAELTTKELRLIYRIFANLQIERPELTLEQVTERYIIRKNAGSIHGGYLPKYL